MVNITISNIGEILNFFFLIASNSVTKLFITRESSGKSTKLCDYCSKQTWQLKGKREANTSIFVN